MNRMDKESNSNNDLSFRNILNNIFFQCSILWFIWIFVGTIFYTYIGIDALSWAKGFYMAVNVGYCIGWGYPTEKDGKARWFSIFYLLIGSSAVATSLAMFARSAISTSKDWYATALKEDDEKDKIKNLNRFELVCFKISNFITKHEILFKAFIVWMFWMSCILLFAFINIPSWGIVDCIYFAISTFSTSGLFAIPDDSPAWFYGVTAIFACTGVPIMAFTMGCFGSALIPAYNKADALKSITADITAEEILMMQKMQLDDGDGYLSRSEYILLCCVRLGALSPDLIALINKRFNSLDINHDSKINYAELITNSQKLLLKKEDNIIDDDNDTKIDDINNDNNNVKIHNVTI